MDEEWLKNQLYRVGFDNSEVLTVKKRLGSLNIDEIIKYSYLDSVTEDLGLIDYDGSIRAKFKKIRDIINFTGKDSFFDDKIDNFDDYQSSNSENEFSMNNQIHTISDQISDQSLLPSSIFRSGKLIEVNDDDDNDDDIQFDLYEEAYNLESNELFDDSNNQNSLIPPISITPNIVKHDIEGNYKTDKKNKDVPLYKKSQNTSDEVNDNKLSKNVDGSGVSAATKSINKDTENLQIGKISGNESIAKVVNSLLTVGLEEENTFFQKKLVTVPNISETINEKGLGVNKLKFSSHDKKSVNDIFISADDKSNNNEKPKLKSVIESIVPSTSTIDSLLNRIAPSVLKHGKLYIFTRTNIRSSWALRHVTADLLHNKIEITKTIWKDKSNDGDPKFFWLYSGCIILLLHGEYYGRKNCIQILFVDTNFTLTLAFETNSDALAWYDFFESMLYPSPEINEKRKFLFSSEESIALVKASSYTFSKFKNDRNLPSVRILKSSKPRSLISYDGDISWRTGHPFSKYSTDSYEFIGVIPTEFRMAYANIVDVFKNRHQEEIRRFFTSKQYNIYSTKNSLSRHIEWRKLNIPIRPQLILNELAKGICFTSGHDRLGHPVIYFFESKYMLNIIDRDISSSLKMLLYRFEQAISLLPNRDGKVLVVIDRRGHNEILDKSFLKVAVKVFRENYPERLYKCLIIQNDLDNTNTVTGIINEILVRPLRIITNRYIKRLVGSNTFSKIEFLKSHEELIFYIDKEYLLVEHGGSVEMDIQSLVARSNDVRVTILEPPLWTSDFCYDYYPPRGFYNLIYDNVLLIYYFP